MTRINGGDGKFERLKLNDAEMKRMYLDEVRSLVFIAKLAGCSKNTVANRLRAMDVEMRKVGRKNKNPVYPIKSPKIERR